MQKFLLWKMQTLNFENLIKKWKKDIENKISNPENSKNEYFYFSNFTIFKNENIGITSILYKESFREKESSTFLKYYSLNLKGNKKIEISEIISKDQLDSLINVLKEQLNSRIKDFYVKGKHSTKKNWKKNSQQSFQDINIILKITKL